MFSRLPDTASTPVGFFFEGRPLSALAGDSVAAALAAAGIEWTRTTPGSGAPRAPYCQMGVCFECLVTIDGQHDRQACMTPIREGMRVARQIRGAEVVP